MRDFVVLWSTIGPFLFTSEAQRPPVSSVSAGGVNSEDLDLRNIGGIAPMVPLGERAWDRSAAYGVKGRLKVGGKRVMNLRLSGEQAIPVVYSNGFGTAAQFTAWMADQGTAEWDAYCHRVGRNITPCGLVLGPSLVARTMRSRARSQAGPRS